MSKVVIFAEYIRKMKLQKATGTTVGYIPNATNSKGSEKNERNLPAKTAAADDGQSIPIGQEGVSAAVADEDEVYIRSELLGDDELPQVPHIEDEIASQLALYHVQTNFFLA